MPKTDTEDPIALIEMLQFQLDAGVDVTLDETPHDHLTPVQVPENPSAAQRSSILTDQTTAPVANHQPSQTTRPSTQPSLAVDEGASIENAQALAAGAATLEDLRAALEAFDGCALKKTAKNLVFADGNPDADIMFVGEAPGRDEDLSGKPFVGRAGQLLDKMLSGIGLDRTSAYITNVIPWRPPGNRDPSTLEVAVCLPFIKRHIELVKPKILVTLGNASTKTLLETSTGILRMRGKWHEYGVEGLNIPVMATLHPAYLLRQSGQKRLAWQDLLKIHEAMQTLKDDR